MTADARTALDCRGAAVSGSREAAVGDRVLPCDLCGDARVFVPVYADGDCPDGHAECPEWACADCGGAILIGFDAPLVRTTGTVVVPHAA